MREMLSKCCFRCDLCLAHRDNIALEDMRQDLSEGWRRFFDLDVPADQICCDGCMAEGDPHLQDSHCPVRPCVIARGLSNCSECADYPCERIEERLVVFEDLSAGKQLSEQDRDMFIRPYENKDRIEALRAARRASDAQEGTR